ncbi:MAG: hypothetical protein ACREK5_10970 [Gemmatimonadota bacterium]
MHMISLMRMFVFPSVPCLAICTMAVLVGGWDAGLAQEPSPAAPSLRVGPTVEARAVTARSLLRGSIFESPSVQLRYNAYERDFARAFGFPLVGATYADSQSFWSGLEQWLNTRWGDTTVFGWVERGLLLYSRFQASTQFERRGFNMDLDVEDVAEGKFGVRVSRSLDQQ